MTTSTRRWIMVSLSITCLLLAGAVHWVGTTYGDDAKPKGAWQPKEEERSAYRDIVDFNIFRADRRRIAENVDRQRNPPTPRDTTPRETVEVTETTPKDPDASWRLTGISHDADGSVAYIEHTETGELKKVAGEGDFSAGRISEIGYGTIAYTIDGSKRSIHVGETLLGERVRPAGVTTTSSPESSDRPASLEDRLRELRERRAREQGEAPPPAPGTRARARDRRRRRQAGHINTRGRSMNTHLNPSDPTHKTTHHRTHMKQPHHKTERQQRHATLWPAAALLAALLALPAPLSLGQDAAADNDAAQAEPVSDVIVPEGPLVTDGLIMNFDQASLKTVLDYLAEKAGLIIVNEAELQGRITMFNKKPVSLDEAITVLNTVLFEEKFTAVRRDRVLKIVSLEDAKRQSIPVHYGNDPDQIPQTDTIVTHIVPIRFANADEIREDIDDLIDDEFAEMASNRSSNAIIITDTQANIPSAGTDHRLAG